MEKSASEQRIFKELRETFPGLSDEEFELFKVIMSHKDETFLFSRRIRFTFESLLTQFSEEDSKENREKMSDRLKKLAYHQETNRTQKSDYHVYSLFSDLSIFNGPFIDVEETLGTAYVTSIVLDHYRRREVANFKGERTSKEGQAF